MRRRAFLRALSLLFLSNTLGVAAPEKQGLTLPQFLRLSALLTGFGALEPQVGQRYLARLQRQRGMPTRLRELYAQLGLDSTTPPTHLDEVSDAILFAREESTLLCEAIVTFWCEQRYGALSSPWSLTSSRASRG